MGNNNSLFSVVIPFITTQTPFHLHFKSSKHFLVSKRRLMKEFKRLPIKARTRIAWRAEDTLRLNKTVDKAGDEESPRNSSELRDN